VSLKEKKTKNVKFLAKTQILPFKIVDNELMVKEGKLEKCEIIELPAGKACVCPAGKDFDATCEPTSRFFVYFVYIQL
jgi:hypothetical protein